MRRILATLAMLTGYAVSCQGAFDPYYVIKVDIQTPTDQFVIDRAFLGNNTFIAADVYTDGVAYTNLTDWAFRLFYSRTQFATSGVTIAASSVSSNRVYFQGATNTYFDPFDDYWVSLIGTATNGLVKTFGTGRLIVEHDPFAGSPTTLVGTTPLNWNLMGPYSGTWPIYSGNTNTMTVTSTSTGAVLTVASSGGGSTSTLYRVVSTSALIQVTGEYGPAAQIGLSSSVLTTATLFTGDVRGVWNDLQIQASTVASSNIIDATIATADIADDAVNGDKIAADSILSTHISDGEIENADIGAAAAIAMSKIAGLAALSNNFVTATGTLATVVASDALKLTSSHWAAAVSTTGTVLRSGDTMLGHLNMGGKILTNATNVVSYAFHNPRNGTQNNSGLALGGDFNQVGQYCFVGGGYSNRTGSGGWNVIAGGNLNRIEDDFGFVGGGVGNIVEANYASVVGGQNNDAAGDWSFVGGGDGNLAQDQYASVIGGRSNNADAAYTVSGGRQAKATNVGAFVFSDSIEANYGSHGSNSVNFRAGGGFWLTETMAFNGSGKLQSGVTTNTGSDGNAMLRSGTNVYWGAPLVTETSTFANVIGRGGQLNASTLTNLNAGAITGTVPAAVITASSIATGTPKYIAVTQVLAGALGGVLVSNMGSDAYVSSTNPTGFGWSGVAATQTVNMAGNAVTNLNRIGLVGQTNLVPIRGDLFASNGVVYFVGTSGSSSAQYGENNLTIGNYQTIASAQAAATNYARWLGNSPPTSNTANGSHMEIRMNQTNVFIYNVASGKWFRITGNMEW